MSDVLDHERGAQTGGLIGHQTIVPAQEIAVIEGSSPLKNRKHERFCWLIAQLRPKGEAYRSCQFKASTDHAAEGNAARLLRRSDITARIAYLSRQEEEILQAKRARIEEFLWHVHEANYADLWETIEVEKHDKKGSPVKDSDGNPVMVKRQVAKPLHELPDDVQRVVETCQVDEHGRVIPKAYSKMQANQELRKLLGIGTIAQTDEVAKMSTTEIVAELQTLGVNVQLSVQVSDGRGNHLE